MNIVLLMEEVVKAYILELTAEQVKAANANINEEDLASIIVEAVQWARMS